LLLSVYSRQGDAGFGLQAISKKICIVAKMFMPTDYSAPYGSGSRYLYFPGLTKTLKKNNIFMGDILHKHSR
jgi:hypothetical protein